MDARLPARWQTPFATATPLSVFWSRCFRRRSPFMKWRSWLVDRTVLLSAAAVMFGVCAYLLAHRYLQGEEAVARRQLAGQYATRDILVAAQALPAGAVLEAGMLAHRAVPERFL